MPLSELLKSNLVPPPEAREWLDVIETMDAGSTYFRYPQTGDDSKDQAKSSMKAVDPVALLNATEHSSTNAFIYVDDDGNVVEAFAQSEEELDDILESLRRAVELFEGIHAGMRAELTGGL